MNFPFPWHPLAKCQGSTVPVLATSWHISSAAELKKKSLCVCRCLSGSTGDSLEVWKELDLAKVEQDLRGVLSRGITSLAVLFLHSYTYVALNPEPSKRFYSLRLFVKRHTAQLITRRKKAPINVFELYPLDQACQTHFSSQANRGKSKRAGPVKS